MHIIMICMQYTCSLVKADSGAYVRTLDLLDLASRHVPRIESDPKDSVRPCTRTIIARLYTPFKEN